MTASPGAGPLSGIRVLEFDGPLTAHAGRLLWELGADVVLVEPRDGSPMRTRGHGAVFAHHHAGKAAIALDPTRAPGRGCVAALLGGADVVVEGTTADSLRPDADDVAAQVAADRGLVRVVCSPYGTTGPRAGAPASDLVVSALGGIVAQIGWPDAPPLAAPGDQAWHLTALNGAIGVLLALAARRRTGHGQTIEVAALECVAASLETGALLYIHADDVAHRTGTAHPLAPHRLFRAADGWVAGGLGGNPRMWDGLLDWMDETDEVGDLRSEELRDPALPPEQRERVFDAIEKFTCTRTRDALFHEAQRRRLPWAAVADLDEVAASPQLLARNALAPVAFADHEGVDALPPWHRPAARRVAPPIEPAGGSFEWPSPAQSVAPAPEAIAPRRGALDDVTVLDLTWVLAGPYATRILADHGAHVVKVESRHRPDPTRFSQFSHLSRGAFDPDTSGYFNNVNRNKRSITLNLRSAAGVDVFLQLVGRADVVIENFSAGLLDRMGIGADVLRARNPRLVVVSMSGLGATGPWRDYVSYADAVSALSGLTALSLDDGRPTPVVHGLADIVAGHHAALATLAALAERTRTGAGAAIDLSELEAMAGQIGPSLLARTATGAAPERRGTGGAVAAPEGVYRCLGPDRWVAITVPDDDAWRALATLIGRPDLAADPRFAHAPGRQAAARELDAALAAWTAPRAAAVIEDGLAGIGVAAGGVQDGRDLVEHDAQLRALGFYRIVEHPRAGAFAHEGIPIRMSATPGDIWDPAPLLGADTDAELASLGGLTPDAIAELRDAGVLE